MKKIIFLILILASIQSYAQTATDSATARRYMACCGFDYECDTNGNIVRNVPTAPKAANTTPIMSNNPNTVNLSGGSRTVDIIDKKNTAMPSLKQKEMPKFPEKQERYRGGIDYAPPKTKPTTVLPELPPGMQPQPTEQQAQVKPKKVEMPQYKPWEKEKPVENKVESKSEPKPVAPQPKPVAQPIAAKPQPVDPNLPTGPSIKTKEMPLPGEEPINTDSSNTMQPAKQPITDRAFGAHEIFELHEGNAIQKSKPLKEDAGRWTKPLKEDDWKDKEEPKVKEHLSLKEDKAKQTKPKKQEETEQKTVIKKMDTSKWKKKDNFGSGQHHVSDPFANDKYFERKYESKEADNSDEQLYGGESEEDLMRVAAGNKKAARLERERREAEERARAQVQADTADAIFINGLVNAGMQASMRHYTKPKHGTIVRDGGKPADVYRRGYADEKYGSGSYNAPDPNKSTTWNKAKGMTGGGGW